MKICKLSHKEWRTILLRKSSKMKEHNITILLRKSSKIKEHNIDN